MAARLIVLALAWAVLPARAFDHSAWDALLKKHVVVLPGAVSTLTTPCASSSAMARSRSSMP